MHSQTAVLFSHENTLVKSRNQFPYSAETILSKLGEDGKPGAKDSSFLWRSAKSLQSQETLKIKLVSRKCISWVLNAFENIINILYYY